MTANTPAGKALERRAWARMTNDGIMDIYLGVLFLNVVVWMIAGELGYAYSDTAIPPLIVLISAPIIYQVAKLKITKPRVGHFKIEKRRLSKKRLGLFLSVVVTAMLVVFTSLAAAGAFPEGLPVSLIIFGVFGLQFVLGFSLAAYFLGIQRFYTYALLGAVGWVGSEILVAYEGISRGWDVVGILGLPALALFPVGIVLLMRFLRENPVREA